MYFFLKNWLFSFCTSFGAMCILYYIIKPTYMSYFTIAWIALGVSLGVAVNIFKKDNYNNRYPY